MHCWAKAKNSIAKSSLQREQHEPAECKCYCQASFLIFEENEIMTNLLLRIHLAFVRCHRLRHRVSRGKNSNVESSTVVYSLGRILRFSSPVLSLALRNLM